MSSDTNGSVYFYGVVRGELADTLAGVTPIDGEGDVYGIAYKELTAIVSDAHRARYEVSRRHVLGHEAVVTALMERHDVLPARFGSVRGRTEIVDELLVAHYDACNAQIARVAGMIALGLKVSWAQVQSIIAEIVAGDPKLQVARRRMAAGHASQNLRLDVGKRVEQMLGAKRVAEAADIVKALAPYAAHDGVCHNDLGDEAEVLDAAFLVSRARVEEFREAVTSYDRHRGERYRVRLATPTAPYGFVTSLEKVVSQEERARR